MFDLLYELYNGEYNITPKQDQKQRELVEKLCAEWDKVQMMFGDEFTDHLLELEAERDDWRAFRCYQAGFRLGIRLMLEGLMPA